MLKNKSLDINAIDAFSGVNAFWLACYYGRGSIMRELAGAGIDIYNSNIENVNVFHLAIYKNLEDIVQLLLKSNFSIELLTFKGYSIFHLCCILNHPNLLKMIFSYLKKS
jgi:ankyrin repeat protein